MAPGSEMFIAWIVVGAAGLATLAGVFVLTRFIPLLWLRSLVRCLAAVALGLSLAAPFLFPSWELIQQSNRGVTSAEEIAARHNTTAHGYFHMGRDTVGIQFGSTHTGWVVQGFNVER